MGMEYSFTVENVFSKYISNGCMYIYLVTSLLEVRHLTTRFHTQERTVHAANDVSFQLAEGETLGIVGESGCGKGVTMLSMMCLVPQPPGKIEMGEIIFEGRNLLELNEGELRAIRGQRMVMIFQDSMTSWKFNSHILQDAKSILIELVQLFICGELHQESRADGLDGRTFINNVLPSSAKRSNL
jgi:ABC-type oligopeptide transport system ATPase subunit